MIMTAEPKENEPQTCWEFMKCPKEIRENCKVYWHGIGIKECWLLIENIAEGCYAYKEHGACTDCPWFKKHNPDF